MSGALESDALLAVFTALAGLSVAFVGFRCLADSRRRAWLFSAAVLLLLAVEYFFELDDVDQRYGRSSARTGGWYADRRVVQTVIMVAAVVAIVVALFAVRRSLRGLHVRDRVLLPATVIMAATVVVSAVSLHQSDAVLSAKAMGHDAETWLGWCSLAVVFGIVVATIGLPVAAPEKPRPT